MRRELHDERVLTSRTDRAVPVRREEDEPPILRHIRARLVPERDDATAVVRESPDGRRETIRLDTDDLPVPRPVDTIVRPEGRRTHGLFFVRPHVVPGRMRIDPP